MKQKPSARRDNANGQEPAITSILREKRVFTPSEEFTAAARIRTLREYRRLVKRAENDPDGFWGDIAGELHWYRPWKTLLRWKAPFAKWFVGGRTNMSYNCLDRHLDGWRRTKAAIIWEGEPGEIRTLTYGQLHSEVCRFANVLQSLGVKKGDTVAIYMGMVPEAAIAMLACTRIGAAHNVVFGGFSAEALRERMIDSGATLLVTQDVAVRRGTEVRLKDAADDAVAGAPLVENVVVYRRTGTHVRMHAGRDHWWHELMSTASPVHKAEQLDSEHPLYILYTSGSTGKPKGIFHTLGGNMVWSYYTSRMVFDMRDEDIYWCTADIGWVTGHAYVIYGPLLNGATTLLYEGAPNWPEPDRFWDIIERHRVSVFYTAPTAIRAFMRWGEGYPRRHDLKSLRLLGTVGEPINPQAWMWYHATIGGRRCPIVDTWWQTETGGIMISPLPGATPTKPGSATLPLPGVHAEVVRRDGTTCRPNEGGLLVIKHPWPSMLRTLHGDDERYARTYWSQYKGWYFTGDGARRDEDGYFWIMGRVDDVVNVAGHRLGTAEIESSLVSHKLVSEAAVVARPDDVKGNALIAFVTLKSGHEPTPTLKEELRVHVGHEIGHIAKPDEIRFTDSLPKTRSGKIMRRLLREIASTGQITGDVTTLEDFTALEKLRAEEEE
ncbi:MAG TPA: acetate--CoA ligase [Candidatus Kapabacteria bacterium]|nr:acetate--CoA ligase [Candidatus Kapabacteria bacterium]